MYHHQLCRTICNIREMMLNILLSLIFCLDNVNTKLNCKIWKSNKDPFFTIITLGHCGIHKKTQDYNMLSFREFLTCAS